MPWCPWVSASFPWEGWHSTAKGSDVRPDVPWVSASFAWQAPGNVHCQGSGCTPWRPLCLRVAQFALARGRMYCLASLRSPPLLRSRCGSNYSPMGSDIYFTLASLGAPQLLRGRCGTIRTAKGSDVRPGVPWVSASFACQAWDNVHCQGVGCLPWRPSLSASFACQARNEYCQGVGYMPWLSLIPGVTQFALSRDRMYGLASLRFPPFFAWQAWTIYTAKGVGCTA